MGGQEAPQNKQTKKVKRPSNQSGGGGVMKEPEKLGKGQAQPECARQKDPVTGRDWGMLEYSAASVSFDMLIDTSAVCPRLQSGVPNSSSDS